MNLKYITVRDKLSFLITGGGIAGNIIAFGVGFTMGTLQGILGAHAVSGSGFDLHSLKQHREPQMAVLPWILMWVLGYNLGLIANRGFDCSQNPSCLPYPPGPFGGGGGGGW